MPVLTPEIERAIAIAYDWSNFARAEQIEPSIAYDVWLILAGRGWGKSRTGAETIRGWVADGVRRIHLVGRTTADARDTMVFGESGILAVCAGDLENRPTFNGNRRSIFWPNGAQAIVFSSERPNALRGPQCERWWADEVAAWGRPQETWDNLQFGARLGADVRGVVTTTPRPVQILKDLLVDDGTHTVKGNTYDNASNLAANFLRALARRYEGTRLGRQEIYAEMLDDNPLALWRRAELDEHRVTEHPDLARVVVAVDPAATATGDETGIVAVGVGSNDEYYVLGDKSRQGSPDEWATAAVAAFNLHNADRLVYESNQGGDMVASTLRTKSQDLPIDSVHASRGKYTRAEPVAALYEQGRVHHVGAFAELEDQLCEWEPGNDSPDRLDALVWAVSYLSGSSTFAIT